MKFHVCDLCGVTVRQHFGGKISISDQHGNCDLHSYDICHDCLKSNREKFKAQKERVLKPYYEEKGGEPKDASPFREGELVFSKIYGMGRFKTLLSGSSTCIVDFFSYGPLSVPVGFIRSIQFERGDRVICRDRGVLGKFLAYVDGDETAMVKIKDDIKKVLVSDLYPNPGSLCWIEDHT